MHQNWGWRVVGEQTKSQNFGIEGQKKLWRNQFDRLSKINFFNAFGTGLVKLTL